MPNLIKNRATHFKVAINSIEVADFRAVRGLDLRTEVVEYREGGINERSHKLVGDTRFARITLEHGSSDSTELYEWVKAAMEGKAERKDGSIMAIDQAGDVVARWEFRAAWPCGYEGPRFAGATNLAGIERLTLAHKGFELKPGDVKYETDGPQTRRGGESGGESEKDGPSKHEHDHLEYPERTKAAQEECKKVCAAAQKAGMGNVTIAVFTEENEAGEAQVVHVGMSGAVDKDGNTTKKGERKAAALQKTLNKDNKPPPTYVVNAQPVGYEDHVDVPPNPTMGNCGEPKAASTVPGGGAKADGFDVRHAGTQDQWEKPPIEGEESKKDKYEYSGDDKDPDQTHPQMDPCGTCSHPTNRDGILGDNS